MYFSYRQALWFCKSHVWKKMWLRGPFLISIFSYLIYVPYLKPDYQQNRLTKQLWKLPKVIKVINLPTYLVLQGVEIQLNYFISNAGLFVPASVFVRRSGIVFKVSRVKSSQVDFLPSRLKSSQVEFWAKSTYFDHFRLKTQM